MEGSETQGNLVMGIVAGLIAAVIGAALWAVITAVTEYQIGFMAIGVGLLVGIAVRTLGNGSTQQYAIVGAIFALLGCALGNLLTITYFLSINESAAFMDTLFSLTLDDIIQLMTATFEAMDLLFYALAVYCGFKYAVVETGEAEPEQTA